MNIEEMFRWYETRIDTYRHHVVVYDKIKYMLDNRDYIVEELRELYRKNKFLEMRKLFYKNLFYLSREKREQIFAVLARIKIEPEFSEEDKKKGQQLIDFCVEEMGCRVVEE